MNFLALILFYLAGYASAYYLFRYLYRCKMQERWTRMSRLACLFAAITSWLGVLLIAGFWIVGKLFPDYDPDQDLKK